jgi:hypothetical protein
MRVPLLVIAFLLAAALPAHAEDDVPLPPITLKGEFLVMTQDDATSSSKCIGNPVTPMCAVETFMAAGVRGNLDLKRIALGIEGGPWFDNQGPTPPIIYRIRRREVLTDKTFPWPPKSDADWRWGGLTMRAGDIRIDVVDVRCYSEISLVACEKYWGSPIAYIVRHQGNRWIVVTWREPYDLRQ